MTAMLFYTVQETALTKVVHFSNI